MSVKFPMHDMHMIKSLKQVKMAIISALVTGFLYHSFIHVPLKSSYDDFYSTYDPNASFKRMMEAGYLDSCPAPKK